LSITFEFSAAANIVDASVLGYERRELTTAIWDKSLLSEFRGINDGEVFIALDNAGEF